MTFLFSKPVGNPKNITIPINSKLNKQHKFPPTLPKPNLEGQFKMMHNPIEWEI
jgi:hypothetical protein